MLNSLIHLDLLKTKKMNRLDKEGLLGPWQKLVYQSVSPIWKEKLTESGPMNIKACHAASCLFTLKNDYSHYSYVYLFVDDQKERI